MEVIQSTKMVDGLNEDQAKAVTHVKGALLLLAPVGTGKTEVLARRAAHAIQSGIIPSKILCLSFTNKAAKEVGARIEKLIPKEAEQITTSTFHALCTKILRTHAERVGLTKDFSIYDDEDTNEIVKSLLEQFQVKVLRNIGASRKLHRTYINFLERAKLAAYSHTNPKSIIEILEEEIHQSTFKEGDLDISGFPKSFCPEKIFNAYNAQLTNSNAVSFSDLVIKTIGLFTEFEEIKVLWQNQYEWIQVDEVQDTSRTEYRVLRYLAMNHKNLAFFGDSRQTIYEWRDSEPKLILRYFEKDFAPVEVIRLTKNYRSTKTIVNACQAVLREIEQNDNEKFERHALDASTEEQGKPIGLHLAENSQDEALWIASKIKELHDEGKLYQEMIILTRQNFPAEAIGDMLKSKEIPSYLVDESKFYKYPEIKDALAHVQLIFNQNDAQRFIRVLQSTSRGFGEKTIEQLTKNREETGFLITDLLNPLSYRFDEPFQPMFEKLNKNEIVIFDTETTGKNFDQDEIIEIAALKIGRNGEVGRFNALIKPTTELGESVKVHGLTEEYLNENGKEANEVIPDFLKFIEGCALIGHFVEFDIQMLRSACSKLNLMFSEQISFDTLDMSRRFFRLADYKLSTLCNALGIGPKPNHRAMEDTLATSALFSEVLPMLEKTSESRHHIISVHSEKTKTLALQYEKWKEASFSERPRVLLERILDDTELKSRWFEKGEKHTKHLEELLNRFESLDRTSLSPRSSLKRILEIAGLGGGNNFLLEEDRVPIYTVHQAKGLEFDTVFIASATDNNFPDWRSVKQNREAEEQRIFYVAMTRARKQLFISSFKYNDNGYAQKPSRYIRLIPNELIEKM